MTTFILPPDMASRISAAVAEGRTEHVEIVEGEVGWEHDADNCPGGDQCVYGVVPPARFVALDKACETPGCVNGRMPVYQYPRKGGEPRLIDTDRCPNPDCVGGRQVWELRTVCRHKRWTNQTGINYGAPPRCADCGTTRPVFGAPDAGSILVCRATVRVVPVVAWNECRAAVTEPYPAHICVRDDGTCRWIPNTDVGIDIALDPLPRPGVDFGVIFEVVA